MSVKIFGTKNLGRKILIKILYLLSILILITLFVVLWEKYVTAHDIPKRILPKPSDILEYAQKEFFTEHRRGYESLLAKSFNSFFDAIIGFLISAVLGTLIGITFAIYKFIKEGFSPVLFIIQLLPVPAFAPVIASMLGYGLSTKIFIIVLFTIFPFTVAAHDAVKNIPHYYKSLLETYNADKIKTYIYLILPAVIPNLLHTMRIAAPASIVASIIAELPLTVSNGIGKDIYTSFNNQIIPRVWLSLIIISVISLLFFGAVSFLDEYINRKYKYGQFK